MPTNSNTEAKLLREIELIISDISNSVIDDLSGVSRSDDSNLNSHSHSISILDIYEHLQETERNINETISSFRDELDHANNTSKVNNAIFNFTSKFYRLRDTLDKDIRIYNSVHFTESQEARVGKLYMDKCFKKINKHRCLAKLVKDHLR